ncbi:uncharacterized protein LOC112053275 [Bicyclus anynana]|uniref:Uncharacterized protein LOC112053275 n=1 Tax=Bicyclus anynana TaxID=110368 RepID=A0A6J1NY90_BICAN|nr:uncharacterized protein LOC112053275 [Bicyclus anynana]
MFNVSPVLVLLAIAFHSGVITKSPDKPSGPNCQTFSEGVEFNDTDAVGAWHLLHFRTEKTKGSGDPHCVEFMPIDVKERNRLQKDVGKFVENLDWETLTLKMTIPCKTEESNKTRSYYLERLEDNGSYRTLQLPIYSVKFDFAAFHRYPMRLKLIEGEYLGIMDCHEKFVFIMGKDQPKGKETDERLKKMIETYWPEE